MENTLFVRSVSRLYDTSEHIADKLYRSMKSKKGTGVFVTAKDLQEWKETIENVLGLVGFKE